MSASKCLRCLVRPSPTTLSVSVPQHVPKNIAPFSTTGAKAGQNPKPAPSVPKNPNALQPYRSGKKMTLSKFKKNKVIDRGKAPLPGERKAWRKRISLSNDNALPVPWLTQMRPGDMADSGNVAKVFSLPAGLQDQLRACEAFKPTQSWNMFRTPSVLVRNETVDVMGRMQQAAGENKTARLVLTGDKFTGKSLMLLQAMAHAYLNEWIVIHVPDAQELTTASTEYAPIPGTDPVQYMQPNYVLKLIQNFRKANEAVLSKTYTATAHPELPQNITVNTPLLNLCQTAKEPEGAWVVFRALWNELMAKNVPRPPILFTLDGLAHIMKMSDYRSPSFELIHSHDLAFVRHFTELLAGNTSFPGGGAVIAATSRSNAPRVPSMELVLAQREAEQAPRGAAEVPQPDPFFRGYDKRVESVLRSVDVVRVNGASKPEARSLMEYWAASGLLRDTVDEKLVTEKWALGGNGVLGEMERAALMTMRI